MEAFDYFLSFEWLRGLLVAQALRAALSAASRAPPRGWFALEHDAAKPAAMEAGVRASAAFVVVLTDGYFTPNVRHEVACAVSAGKRVVVLHDAACGRGVEALLDQAAALADPAVIAGKGLRHLDAAGAAEFKARALVDPAIPFYRDARLVTEVAPALAAAVAAVAAGAAAPPPPALQKPFKVRALRPAAGDCDALIVAAGDATLQALYLAEAAKGACGARPLVAEVLPPESSAYTAQQAVARAGAVVLVLSSDAWSDAALVVAAWAALGGKKRLALVHEADANFGGAPAFGAIMAVTPAELKPVYSSAGLAVPLSRGQGQEALMLGKLLPKLGCEPTGAPRLPPPPLPPGYNAGATAVPLAAARRALLAPEVRPAAIALGGLGGAGKTTVAAAIAGDAHVAAAFDDVVWLPVGKVSHADMVELLEALLRALEVRAAEAGGDAGESPATPSTAPATPSTAPATPSTGHATHFIAPATPSVAPTTPSTAGTPALATPAAAATSELNTVASLVWRLRAVFARRAVLLVVDDVWAPDGWNHPDAAALLLDAVDVAPEHSGGASVALFTSRDADDSLFVRLEERAQRGLRRVKMAALEEGVAAAYLAEAAQLDAVSPGVVPLAQAVQPVLRAFGTLPLALTLVAACLRAQLDETDAPLVEAVAAVVALRDGAPLGAEPGAPAPGQCLWLHSAQFCDVLQHANPGWRLDSEEGYVAIYRALQATIAKRVNHADRPKFATFGLLEKHVYLPEAVFSATWGLEEPLAHALLTQWQDWGLIKWEPHARRILLHDLAHDFATAMAATNREIPLLRAHNRLLKGSAKLVEVAGGAPLWWRAKPGVEAGAAAYVGGGHLLRHLREAARGEEGTTLVWRLPWLIYGVAERGGATVIREVAAQLAWEQQRAAASGGGGGAGGDAAAALSLLHQALVMGAAALSGHDGPRNVAPQVLGRLGELKGGAGGARVRGLLEEAAAWDGGGRGWLKPLKANFHPPGSACEAVLEGHTNHVLSVCDLGDGRLVSAAADGALRVWDAGSGACLRVLHGHKKNIRVECVCALGGGFVASASRDGSARVWNADSGVCEATLPHGGGVEVYTVCSLGDGVLATAASDKKLCLWEWRQSARVRGWWETRNTVRAMCALGEGRFALALKGAVDVVSQDGAILHTLRHEPKEEVRCVCSLGSGRLASASSDKTVRVWDAATGELLRMLPHANSVYGVCHVGGTLLASACTGNTVRVWDFVAGGAPLRVLEGHSHWLTSVCRLPSGRLASCSYDKTVRVWGTGRGESLRALLGHAGPVSGMCKVEGGRLLTASHGFSFMGGEGDRTLRLWDPATGACLEAVAIDSARAAELASTAPAAFAALLLAPPQRKSSSGTPLPATPAAPPPPPSPLSTKPRAPPAPPAGRSNFFAPPAWAGLSPVYVGAVVRHEELFELAGGRRVAAAGLFDGRVLFFEVVNAASDLA